MTHWKLSCKQLTAVLWFSRLSAIFMACMLPFAAAIAYYESDAVLVCGVLLSLLASTGMTATVRKELAVRDQA